MKLNKNEKIHLNLNPRSVFTCLSNIRICLDYYLKFKKLPDECLKCEDEIFKGNSVVIRNLLNQIRS